MMMKMMKKSSKNNHKNRKQIVNSATNTSANPNPTKQTHPAARNAPMTRHLRCERVPAQRTADRARRRAERACDRRVRSDAAGGDLLEERVDAFLVGADGACGIGGGAGGAGEAGGADGASGTGDHAVRQRRGR